MKKNLLSYTMSVLVLTVMLILQLVILEHIFKKEIIIRGIQTNDATPNDIITNELPDGYIIEMSNHGEYRWKDEEGTLSTIEYNTKEQAIEAACFRIEYVNKKK